MKPIAVNVYILMMFMAYVMRRAGTFTMNEKIRMIDFVSYMAVNPDSRIEEHEGGVTLLGEAMRCQPSQVGRLLALSQASKSPGYSPHP
jgi:hypothetical protein